MTSTHQGKKSRQPSPREIAALVKQHWPLLHEAGWRSINQARRHYTKPGNYEELVDEIRAAESLTRRERTVEETRAQIQPLIEAQKRIRKLALQGKSAEEIQHLTSADVEITIGKPGPWSLETIRNFMVDNPKPRHWGDFLGKM